MLNIQHLTIIKQNNDRLIDDFSFTLGGEDRVALIGEEGNGKSTLLKAIYQPEWIQSYTSISGIIDMDFERIGYLPQRMEACWFDATCVDFLLKKAPEEETDYERYNELMRFQQIAADMGITTDLIISDQPIKTLSGGEKVKLQLLKLMEYDCDCYLLDEPTNDLDLETLRWLESFICNLRVPIMFISHDETLLRRCANRILHLEQRNKKTKPLINDVRCDYDAYVTQRLQKQQKQEHLARKEKREYEKKKERLNDIMNAVHDAQNSVSRQAPHAAKMLKRKMHAVKAMDRRVERDGYQKADDLEEAIDVSFETIASVRDKVILQGTFDVRIAERILIHPFTMDIRGRDKVAIIGKNGCGKTQLIKRIYDVLHPRTDIHLGYMPQYYHDLMDENKIAYHFLSESADQADITASRELLGRMKFTHEEMIQPIKSLSEGQKAKLYLARFIKTKCDVLLLDEPTRNLSPLSAPMMRKLLREYNGCIICVTHDRMLLDEVFDHIWMIEQSQIKQKNKR